jgi:hypothetical protein
MYRLYALGSRFFLEPGANRLASRPPGVHQQAGEVVAREKERHRGKGGWKVDGRDAPSVSVFVDAFARVVLVVVSGSSKKGQRG